MVPHTNKYIHYKKYVNTLLEKRYDYTFTFKSIYVKICLWLRSNEKQAAATAYCA